MKRELIFVCIFLSILIVPVVFAAEADQIPKAYSCLKDKINSSTCEKLSLEEKTFSLLAVQQCKNEVINSSFSDECWPGSSCNIKQTAQAILALSPFDYNTTKAENWLLSKKTIPSDLSWFIEIEGADAVSCDLFYTNYEGGLKINIGADKKISASTNLGNCLTFSDGNYWLEVSPTCYNQEFSIQCNESFITTLLFSKKNSPTINVVDAVHSAAAHGTTTEKVDSWCFGLNNVCDYEGSLWAAETLYYLDPDRGDISAFLPYLIAFSDDNSKLIPESFLFYLTGKFKTELLFNQKAGKYWSESGDEYYDTAVAMMSLQSVSATEKQNSKNWLLSSQLPSGCWDNDNVRNTAFVLFSVWPQYFSPSAQTGICGNGIIDAGEECDGINLGGKVCSSSSVKGTGWVGNLSCYPKNHAYECQFDASLCTGGTTTCVNNSQCPTGLKCSGNRCLVPSNGTTITGCVSDANCSGTQKCSGGVCIDNALNCTGAGYFCISPKDCSSGNSLSNYQCSGLSKCCKLDKILQSCSSQKGEICDADEICKSGTSTTDASGLTSGEVCCINGNCVKKTTPTPTEATCVSQGGGTCKSSCPSEETESPYYSCEFSTDKCCIEQKVKKNYIWLWVLIGLIFIVVLGIVFREKIREWMMRIKTKSKKTPRPEFGMRPLYPPRAVPRRIIPPTQVHQRPSPSLPVRKPVKKSSKELDEVLKKLKEIGGK